MTLCEHSYLNEVNYLIDSYLNPSLKSKEETLLMNACRHLSCAASGKRIRPLFFFYCYSLLKDDFSADLINIGAAAELIHVASLIHDDIVDDAQQRRGITSTNIKFGNKTAVLAGDFLLSQAFNLLIPFDRLLTDKAIVVVREMTKAAISELINRGHVDVSIEDITNIALGKTALLFSWCGFAAAIMSDHQEDIENLWNLGKHLGIIFQLADDIKDFHGDNLLKDVCRDIYNLDLSMPLILAIEENHELKNMIKNYHDNKILNNDEAYHIRKIILNTNAITKTKNIITKEINKAYDIIDKYHKNTLFIKNIINEIIKY